MYAHAFAGGSFSFHLPIFEFNWSTAAENGHGNAELPAFRVDFFDHTVLALERAISHLDGVTNLKTDQLWCKSTCK